MALNTEITMEYQAWERKGWTRAEIDAVAVITIGRELSEARKGSEVTKVAVALRNAEKPAPAPAPTRAVDPATGAVAPEPRATTRQVDYAAELLGRRVQSGEGGGYAGTSRYVTADRWGRYTVNLDALRALSRSEISRLIDSLKGNY
jgi:hypothetical protein